MYAEPSNVCILKLCSNLSVKSLALMEHEESYLHLRLFFNPCELEHLDDKGNGVWDGQCAGHATEKEICVQSFDGETWKDLWKYI